MHQGLQAGFLFQQGDAYCLQGQSRPQRVVNCSKRVLLRVRSSARCNIMDSLYFYMAACTLRAHAYARTEKGEGKDKDNPR